MPGLPVWYSFFIVTCKWAFMRVFFADILADPAKEERFTISEREAREALKALIETKLSVIRQEIDLEEEYPCGEEEPATVILPLEEEHQTLIQFQGYSSDLADKMQECLSSEDFEELDRLIRAKNFN
jgi:hypothetical protein